MPEPTVWFVPTKSSCIFSKINPLFTDTGLCGQRTLFCVPSHRVAGFLSSWKEVKSEDSEKWKREKKEKEAGQNRTAAAKTLCKTLLFRQKKLVEKLGHSKIWNFSQNLVKFSNIACQKAYLTVNKVVFLEQNYAWENNFPCFSKTKCCLPGVELKQRHNQTGF